MRNMNNEQGRSMIEMLGVLAIVGVLSVAGIQGYSKAMAKYKINQVMDEVSTIAANTKTLFASQGQYTDLTDTATAKLLGLFPDNMTRTATVLNAMNGETLVAKTGDGKGFFIVMNGLTDEACIALGTSDWGGSAGYKGLILKKEAQEMPTSNLGAATNYTVTPTTAADAKFTAVTTAGICDCSTATCSAVFEFY